jgi:hypothetical protein
MAVQLNAGDLIRLVVKHANPNTSAIENVWHLIAQGTGTATAENVMDALYTIYSLIYANIGDYFQEDTTFEGIAANIILWAIDKWINIGTLGEDETIGAYTPAGTADPLPDAVSALVRFPTTLPKREGRKYIGPFTENSSDTDGKVSSTIVAALSGLADAVLNIDQAVADSDISLQIAFPYYLADSYSTPSAGIVRSEWAYQRRRKSNVGL